MINESKPLVCVVMACYNDASTVGESIKSIINQSYENWKLIIVDDASTDESTEIIMSFHDARIIVIKNEKNLGLARALNIGIEAVNGAEFIARLDSDDIALPQRLEKQVNYMLRHPSVSICGSNVEMFNESDNGVVYITKLKEDSASLMAQMPFSSPIPHSTWFVRVRDFENFSYDIHYRSSQDYELMSRVLEEGKEIACIPEVLVKYRVRSNSISHKNSGIDLNTLNVQCRIAKMLGMNSNHEYVKIVDLTSELEDKGLMDGIKLIAYCYRLLVANKKVKLFNQRALMYSIVKRIYGAFRCLITSSSSNKN